MYVMSAINDPSKEAKVRFMKKSGQFILLSKKLESGSQNQQYFTDDHRPSTDNPTRYSFDTIDIKSICAKIKTLKIEASRWTFIFVNHSSNECNKKEVVDIDKNLNYL